ncbi:MAG TPA: metallophosphoesterase family protein, partial [Candidatus Polarisedimenticolia bacterium]|nr:metallophosphoesterase family protein [Candidatus Polarisedimenticolia bacterium]
MERACAKRHGRSGRNSVLFAALLVLLTAGVALPIAGFRTSERTLVRDGSPMLYLANRADPSLGDEWTLLGFSPVGWSPGAYGVGYDQEGAAARLIRSRTLPGVFSVFTRTLFVVGNLDGARRLHLGADYDDGFAAWINGVEVYRSPELPAGDLSWNTPSSPHESSNGWRPSPGALHDISRAGIPALREGLNTLAVGVWNDEPGSSDLVLSPRLVLNQATGISRGPYLQLGTHDSVVIRWKTLDKEPGLVRLGTSLDDLGLAMEEPGPVRNHEVEVMGLLPDTRYYYTVGTTAAARACGDGSCYFVTAPAPGSTRPIRIWAIGDSGTADRYAEAVRDAYRAFSAGRHTDLWLMLGDNAYTDGTSREYQRAVFDTYRELLATSVLWPAMGNHDTHASNVASQTGPFFNLFTLPSGGEAGGAPSGTEAWYSFDFGNVHFICLESHVSDRSAAGAMMSWLQQDLASVDEDWVIAYWHHPPYSKGSHNSDKQAQSTDMRLNALPLLESAGVDLVISGHSHAYERSYLLDGHYGRSETLDPSMILDAGDGRDGGDGPYLKPAGRVPHSGAVYIVAGSSGQLDRADL